MISEKRLSYADKRVSTVTSKNKTITIQDFFFCHLSRSIFGQLRYLNYRTFFILVINQLNAQNLFYNKFIPCLYIYLNNNQLDALNFIMSLFHASTCFKHKCSSSGGQNCTIQRLVSSHSAGGRPVHRLREDCSPLSNCAPDGHL